MLAGALKLLWQPVPLEKKRLLRDRWSQLDSRFRTPTQGLGRQATGCGAIIGAQPRCDFDCTGCYLAGDANVIPPRPVHEILRQLDRLREHLGPKGNVQITDGEVTLLPRQDLIAILRHARKIGLIPMVMTHGDSFRRRPGLLHDLVTMGGLTEVALHIDSTQRGRRDYREAREENDLMPLREEFAGMIRQVRRETGVHLRVATTLTISRENLDGVGPVIDWCFRNRDVFGFVSFQPLAQVGRTLEGMKGVSAADLWSEVYGALAPFGLRRGQEPPLMFGHPACTQMEAVAVYRKEGEFPRILPILREGEPEDGKILAEYFGRGLAGATFREDSLMERLCRGAGLFLKDPRWFAGPARRWASRRLAALGTSAPRRLADLARGRVRMDAFTVTAHYFMSRHEIDTTLGRERLAACAFKVPVNGRMVAMCEVNLAGAREDVYAGPAGAAKLPVEPEGQLRMDDRPGAAA